MTTREVIVGDSYTFYLQCYEDSDQTTVLDITDFQSITYKIWKNSTGFINTEPLFITYYGDGNNYIRVPDVTDGMIEVKLPASLTAGNQGQYIHELVFVDESGDSTILFRELIEAVLYT